jgi:hypothetical protein
MGCSNYIKKYCLDNKPNSQCSLCEKVNFLLEKYKQDLSAFSILNVSEIITKGKDGRLSISLKLTLKCSKNHIFDYVLYKSVKGLKCSLCEKEERIRQLKTEFLKGLRSSKYLGEEFLRDNKKFVNYVLRKRSIKKLKSLIPEYFSCIKEAPVKESYVGKYINIFGLVLQCKTCGKYTNFYDYGDNRDPKCFNCSMKKANQIHPNRLTLNKLKEYVPKEYKILSFDNESYNITVCCKKGHVFTRYIHIFKSIPHCPKCHNNGGSFEEKEVRTFLGLFFNEKELDFNNKEILNNNEIDIYIPSKKIGIEYHGVYWHSLPLLTKDGRRSKNKARLVHKTKADLAEKAGIRLIQIFSDEWLYKNEIIKKIIKNSLNLSDERKVYARKCEVREVSFLEAKSFLNEHHFQGCGKVGKIRLGLYYNSELVSLETFQQGSKSQNIKKEDGVYDLYKYVTSCKVVGGLGKLLSYFEKKYNPKKIYSFVDRRFFDGKAFKSLGFVEVSRTEPNYYYFGRDLIRKHRFGFIRNKECRELGMSQKEYWENYCGYTRIYDAGHLRLEKVFKEVRS